MKQIVQNLKTGETVLEEIPVPIIKPGHVLIKTVNSLVSLGTERMLVDFGKASYLQKARQQPEKVRQVIDKIKTDGLKPTVDAVFKKLDQPYPWDIAIQELLLVLAMVLKTSTLEIELLVMGTMLK